MNNLYTLLLILLFGVTAIAQWSVDPTLNTPVCIWPNNQNEVAVATDEQGGAIIVWRDYRDNPGIFEGDIYAQRINSKGEMRWELYGIVINGAVNGQFRPKGSSQESEIYIHYRIAGLLLLLLIIMFAIHKLIKKLRKLME